MALPKEPRQLMINLMYLVLTALLALNVSNEILNAFQVVNESIKRSTGNTDSNTTDFIANFQRELNNPSRRDKALPLYNAAMGIQEDSKQLTAYIEELKNLVVEEAGGFDPENPTKPKDPGNIDAATQIFVESRFKGKPAKDRGAELKAKIEEYISKIEGKIDANFRPEVASQLKSSFPVKIEEVEKSDNNPQGKWATGMFYHVPTTGALTILSKFQNDISNAENQLIQTLYKKISDDVIFIQGYKLVASVNNAYVMAGDKVTGTLNLVPITSSSERRSFSVSAGSVKPDPKNASNTNVKLWETTAPSTSGLKTVSVRVPVTGADGRTTVESAQMQYMVGSAGASLQLDKMNVFYRGVPNPITISAAGSSMEDVSVVIPGANLKKTGLGKYDVTVDGLKANTTVNAVINGKQNGKVVKMGQFPVRIKRIPDPIALFANKNNAKVPANKLQVQRGVIAMLLNFDFDTRFSVVGYSLYVTRGDGGDPGVAKGIKGARLNQRGTDVVKSISPGDKLIIDDIKAKGPDGEIRKLSPIIIDAI